jgi:putative nucleotidyltransferase with HDIG domain
MAFIPNARRRVFIVETASHRGVAQAYALGATQVLIGNLDRDDGKLLRALSEPKSTTVTDEISIRPAGASNVAAGAIASMFRAAVDGADVDVHCTKQIGRQIAEHIGEHGLSHWLKTVRQHHEGTYQHCLLVAGLATDFGLSLGFGRMDLERLSCAALFHDIGKAEIPLAILDKPGQLSHEERAVVESHPVRGFEILKRQEGITSEVLDAVRHHHEYLDGSGYPDRLAGSHISDLVRILTISDIFAALIEFRPYRATMARTDAYSVLCGMSGKVEAALVKAFRPVALER